MARFDASCCRVLDHFLLEEEKLRQAGAGGMGSRVRGGLPPRRPRAVGEDEGDGPVPVGRGAALGGDGRGRQGSGCEGHLVRYQLRLPRRRRRGERACLKYFIRLSGYFVYFIVQSLRCTPFAGSWCLCVASRRVQWRS